MPNFDVLGTAGESLRDTASEYASAHSDSSVSEWEQQLHSKGHDGAEAIRMGSLQPLVSTNDLSRGMSQSKGPSSLENLPAEMRTNIAQQTMRFKNTNDSINAISALKAASPIYDQDFKDSKTLGAEFSSLERKAKDEKQVSGLHKKFANQLHDPSSSLSRATPRELSQQIGISLRQAKMLKDLASERT